MASKQKYFTPSATTETIPEEPAPMVGEITQAEPVQQAFEITVEDVPLPVPPEPMPEVTSEVIPADQPKLTAQTLREMAAGRAVLAGRG